MGQAKTRGTFEQRKAEGMARRAAEEHRRKQREAQRIAVMTPEQKQRQRAVRQLLSIALAVSNPHP